MAKKIVLAVDNGRTEFEHWLAADGIYAVQCPGFLPGPGRLPGWGYVISYVVTGGEKAMLIDTGFGNADLKGYIEKNITTLPLMVINSHVHPDHSGGNAQFDVVYVEEHEAKLPEPEKKEKPKPFKPYKRKYRRSGTGGIYKLNDHLYEGRYTPTNAQGKREVHTVYAKTKEECDALLEKMIAEVRKRIKEELKAKQ